MKRLVSAAAAAALTALTVAGAAQASTMSNTDSAIRSLRNGQFEVVRIASLDHDAAITLRADATVEANAVQQAIHANLALVRDLKARNVEIGNVVAAAEAMDGSVTFYLQ